MNSNPHDPNLVEPDPGGRDSAADCESARARRVSKTAYMRPSAWSRLPRGAVAVFWPGPDSWPTFRPESSWMRTAAAAAIVFVVAGGGWGVYSRVESSRPGNTHFAQSQPAKVIVMPARMPVAGGFSRSRSHADAVTLPGPAVPQPVKCKSRPASKSAKKPVAETQGRVDRGAANSPQRASGASQPDASSKPSPTRP